MFALVPMQLIRSPINLDEGSTNDRNKPGGDLNDMLLFNEAISKCVIVELPLKGRKYT